MIFFSISVDTNARDFPSQDTVFLTAAFCYQTTLAPRLAVDLTNEEKNLGQAKLFEEMNKRDYSEKDFVEAMEPIRKRFAGWAVSKFKNDPDGLLIWFKNNCLN